MPIKSVKLIPGVNVEKTPTLNEAGISQSSFGRFRDGLFQKIGGWAQYFFYNAGIPRALHAWQDLNSVGHLAVGTTSSFGVITSGAVNVLTPQQVTTNPAVNFSTVSGTKLVTVIDASLTGVTTIYDGVYFNTPISVGGLILSGFYSIIEPITSATSYTIMAAKNATSTVNNGGAVPTFTTVSGSAVVTVNLTAHGLVNNDTINFPISTYVGGGTTATVTFTNGSPTITGTGIPSVAGSPITFTTSGSLPTNFSTGTTYFILSGATTDISGITSVTVSSIIGGTAIIAGSAGSGTQTMVYGYITIVGSYVATVASDLDKFTITSNAKATASGTVSMNGAAAQLLYTITLGPAAAGAGYGTGTTYPVTFTNSSANVGGTGLPTSSGTPCSFTTTGALPTNFAPLTASVTFTNGSANISGSGLPTTAGALVTFSGALPIGFDVGNTYYILSGGSSSTITVAASVGGTAIVAGSAGGSGTMAYNNTFFTLGGTSSIITVSAASGGAAIVAGSAGSGTHTLNIGFGSGTYGFGITPGTQTGTPISATNWTIDNWGQDVVACPAGGGIYYWNPTGGFSTLVNILTAPAFNEGIFVSMPQQILVAYGSTVAQNIGVQQDPLLVAWSDIGDFEAWTPLTTNQAGSYRIPTGSKIVGGIQGPQNGLIWTDLDMWSMNYLGYPLVFGFTKVGANCGLAGKHAACQLSGNVYWMGQSNFFMFGGSGVQVIPCPIWDYVFQNVDTANIYKTVACANTSFNEVWWFFPASAGSGEPNRYVKYNTLERTWDYGVLSRTAWIDQSVLGPPIAASPDSYIWQHETTEDAAGSAIISSMQTGYFVVNEAHEKTFIDLIWPDFKYGLYGGSQGASIQVTVYGADYPTDTPTAFGPFTMNSTTQYINLRMRARLVAMKFESSDLGSFWRIGNVRVRYAQDGKV